MQFEKENPLKAEIKKVLINIFSDKSDKIQNFEVKLKETKFNILLQIYPIVSQYIDIEETDDVGVLFVLYDLKTGKLEANSQDIFYQQYSNILKNELEKAFKRAKIKMLFNSK